MLAGGVVEEVAPPEAFSVSESPIVQQFIHGRTEGPIDVL
jgi:ABC-type transporter Mla maintaining outer membrane lipid asymmetry ATPase subunit MlaF